MANITLSRVRRHLNYITYPLFDDCSYVRSIPDWLKCEFVKSTTTCAELSTYMVHYLSFILCTDDKTNSKITRWLHVLLMCLWIIVLVYVNKVIAYKSAAPTVLSIGKTLRLSEYMTGLFIYGLFTTVDEIAFILHAPFDLTDIVSNEMLGQEMFGFCVVVPTAILISPFIVSGLKLLRESVLAVVCIAFGVAPTIWVVNMKLGIAMIILCVAYLMGMISYYYCYTFRVNAKNRTDNENPDYHNAPIQLTAEPNPLHDATFPPNETENRSRNHNLFQQFFNDAIFPYSVKTWRKFSIVRRIYIIITLPINIIAALILPTVDYQQPIAHWSKLLRSINILTITVIVVLLLKTQYVSFSPIAMIVIVSVAVLLAVLVFLFSRTDREPPFIFIFQLLGLGGSIIIFYVLQMEISAALETFGTFLGLRPETIDSTLQVWGFSVSHLAMSIYFSKRGFALIPFAASYSQIVYEQLSLTGIGIIKGCLKYGDGIELRAGTMPQISISFLLYVIVIIFLCFSCSQFTARRTFAFMLYITYALFLLWGMLISFEIIHSFGTDHSVVDIIFD